MHIFKRLRELEDELDKLNQFLPRFYSLLVNEHGVYPCEKFKKVLCSRCDNCACNYHPNNKKDQTAEEIMEEFIKMGCHHRIL